MAPSGRETDARNIQTNSKRKPQKIEYICAKIYRQVCQAEAQQKHKYILSFGVFFWSLFTALSSVTTSFWQIFALRIGVGIGEASCAPAANSMIGDYFPSEKRAKAISIFMLGLPVGLALSFAISGSVAQKYGWRMAFLVAGLPGLICVILALFIKEPKRDLQEITETQAKQSSFSTYKLLLSSPTMRWLIISGAIHNFSLYALSAFITPYMMRFHGLNIQEANFRSMIIYGFVSLPGLLLGGVLGDFAKSKRKNGALLVVTISTLVSIPFFFFALQAESGNINIFLILMGVSVAMMYFYYSIVYSTIADISKPEMRGSAMAIYFMAMYLLGASFGPYVVGLVSDYFSQQAAITAGIAVLTKESIEPFRAAGLRSAMYIVPILSSVLMFVLFAASRTVKKDVEKINN